MRSSCWSPVGFLLRWRWGPPNGALMHGMSRLSWDLGGLPGADPAERDARIAAVVAGAALQPAAIDGWLTLYEQVRGGAIVDIGTGEPMSMDDVASDLRSPNAAVRRRAGESTSRALADHADPLAAAYTSLCLAGAGLGSMRGRPDWLAGTHAGHGTSDAEVDAVVAA